jgi:PhzF family phenazine biosynthesis protein
MSLRLPIWIVDVFAARPLEGNPAAVVFDGDHLDGATMQAIARETNLSETVFLLPASSPSADYRVRIFTPRRELPFAGHPTIAASFAWLRRTSRPVKRLMQECGVGLVPVERLGDGPDELFVMTQPTPVIRDPGIATAEAAALLGCPAASLRALPIEIVSTGVPWILVALQERAALANLKPDLAAIERAAAHHGADGVIAYAPGAAGSRCRTALRTFAPGQGIVEDPACGSGNGSVAIAMRRHGLVPVEVTSWWAEQGAELGRPSRIYVSVPSDGAEVRIGGAAHLTLEGVLTL